MFLFVKQRYIKERAAGVKTEGEVVSTVMSYIGLRNVFNRT